MEGRAWLEARTSGRVLRNYDPELGHGGGGEGIGRARVRGQEGKGWMNTVW